MSTDANSAEDSTMSIVTRFKPSKPKKPLGPGRGGPRSGSGRPKGTTKAELAEIRRVREVYGEFKPPYTPPQNIDAEGLADVDQFMNLTTEEAENDLLWLSVQFPRSIHDFIKKQPADYLANLVTSVITVSAQNAGSSNTPLDSGEAVRGIEEGNDMAEGDGMDHEEQDWSLRVGNRTLEQADAYNDDVSEEEFEIRSRLAPCMPVVQKRIEQPAPNACPECLGQGYINGPGGLQRCFCQDEESETAIAELGDPDPYDL